MSRTDAEHDAGALAEITPAVVLEALSLVRRGEVLDLAHVLDEHVPAFPGRTFRQHLTTNAHAVNRRGGGAGLGKAAVNWIVEQQTATQQMGTHVDGLNHLQRDDRMYGGHRLADVVEEWGTNRLGIETLPQVVTRGVLLDIAAVRGVERLEAGDVVTVDDARTALDRAALSLRPGDAVLFHTGWGALWSDPATYSAGEPGPGLALAAFLVEHRVALTGCDTWSYGPVPAEDPDAPFAVPLTLNVDSGVVVVENLRLAEVAARGLSAFALVLSHAKIRGATGAWTCPLALL